MLSLSFTLYEYVSIDVNDYVDFEGERYRALEKYLPNEKSTVEWEYNVKLYGTESLIKRFLVLNNADGGNEAVFTLTGKPIDHVRLIVQNINEGMGQTTNFKVGTVEGADNVVIDYRGKYCDEALKELADKVGVEWWIDGETVNLCRCEIGEELTLGYGNGLTGIERDVADNAKFYTRLFPIGSSRNIDVEHYGASRLQLPGGVKYVDVNVDRYGVIHHYEEDAFSDIYPRRTGVVSSVRSEEVKDDDGNPFTIYYFKDDSLTFDPNEYEIGGLVKHVSFQEGSELAGLGVDDDHYFEVNYNSDTREFEIITIWPYDDDTQLPGGVLVPKVGDRYILWNIRMPDEYYGLAEKELESAVNEYNNRHALDVSRYKGGTDHVWVEEEGADLYVGRRIRLESSEYFPDTGWRASRITRISRQVTLPSQMDLEISDALSTGALEKMGDDIHDVKNYTAGLVGNMNVPYIIRRLDATKPTDNNLYSSLRSRIEFMCRSVAEIVRTQWHFLKGLTVGTFAAGASGAQINADGDAEVKTITSRGDAYIGGDASVEGKMEATDVATSNSITTPRLTTPSFRTGGLTGEGAGIFTDSNGLTHGEFDFIVARQGLTLTELTIEEERSVGGGIVASHGNGEIEKVVETDIGYSVYIKDTDQFVEGDFVRYARYDHTNSTYRWAWVQVRSRPVAGCILLWKEDFTDGMTPPQPGDVLVQMGNVNDTTRQGFVYITTTGVQCYDGVNSASLLGKCRGVFGDLTGITDNGKALTGYGVWTDTLYIGTGKTAYATFTELYNITASTDSALASYKTEFASRFDVVNGSLTSVQQSVTSLQTGGGRNLLLQTNQGATGWHATTNATYKPVIVAEKSEGGSVLFNYPNGNVSPTYESYDFQLRPELIIEGHTYTLSGEIKAGNADNAIVVLYLATTSGLSHLKAWSVLPQRLKSGEWVKFTATFDATATGTKDGKQWVRFAPNDRGRFTYIAFRDLKLEEGEVATAYTAAPEDYVDGEIAAVNGEIAAVKSTISEVKQTAEEISARVEEVNTNLDGKISTNSSKITQNASAITQEVYDRKEGDAALSSTIEQTASKISLRLSQMALSNINLAKGTETAYNMTSGFDIAKQNYVKTLYTVSGIATGDIATLSLLLRFKGLEWGEGAYIFFSLSSIYKWWGFPLRITQQYITEKGIEADSEGYYTMRIQVSHASPITTDVSATDVGGVVMRLDYIGGGDGAVIEISQLKLELGDTATAWTARTGDLNEALSDTGIDINHRLITATADNFKVLNNNGAVTMEVDEQGNLTSNAVLVRNQDPETAETTPYLTTINLATGFIQLRYPLTTRNANNNVALEIGWDDKSESVFRFFNKDGEMAWKAGSSTSLIDTLGIETITPVEFYKCALEESVKTTATLVGTQYYKKVKKLDDTITTTYYTNQDCVAALSGYFTDPGAANIVSTDKTTGITTYSRVLYTITAGVMSIPRIVTWKQNQLYVKA